MNKTEHATFLNHGDIDRAAYDCVNLMSGILGKTLNSHMTINLYGVPRGGIPAAYAIQAQWNMTNVDTPCVVLDTPDDAHFIVDDLIDSGRTRDHMLELYPNKPFVALFDKGQFDTWVIFPWERAETKDTSAEDIPIRLMQYIGEDVTRQGLRETPTRFINAWRHWGGGYKQKPEDILKVFEDGGEQYDEMVLVNNIPVYSHCEHHLAPFFGVAHVAYIPDGRIVGLSKLSRLVDIFSRRLQVQERLTYQIANALQDALKPKGVAVSISCRHLCMESRGIQRQGSATVTQYLTGVFRDDDKARAEFMGAIK